MTLLEAVVLGLVQGLTEFFPVSSSGHLVLVQSLLGVNPPGISFEVLVHLATAVSVVAVFWRRIERLLVGAWRGDKDSLAYIGMLALATLPAAIAGITLKEAFVRSFESPLLTAVNLLITGGIVFSTRWLLARGRRENPGWVGSLGVGVAQAFALLPGISRSGITVTAALGARTRRDVAAEFSFLLSLPAILGASLLSLPELWAGPASAGPIELGAAALAAFVAGFTAIRLFVRWLATGHFHRFAYYCWAVGSLYILYATLTG